LDCGGEILDVISSYEFSSIGLVFKNFVETFTKMREMGGYYNILGKLMINSLYGGMGLKEEKTHTIITFSEEEFYYYLENVNVINYYNINNSYVINVKKDYKFKKYKLNTIKEEMTIRNVSYAAAITSKARIKLYRAIKCCLLDGGKLLYCDTDSIFAAYPKKNKNVFFGEYR
jgi:hypothetical protein